MLNKLIGFAGFFFQLLIIIMDNINGIGKLQGEKRYALTNLRNLHFFKFFFLALIIDRVIRGSISPGTN